MPTDFATLLDKCRKRTNDLNDWLYVYPLRNNNCLQVTQNPSTDRIRVNLSDVRAYTEFCGLPKRLCSSDDIKDSRNGSAVD